MPHANQSPIEIEWRASDIGHAMATASTGEPEPRPSAEKKPLSQKDEIKALYRRRQDGEISQAEYSELRLGIIHGGHSDDSDERRFWALFTGGSIAATAALILFMFLIDPDECSSAFALSGLMLAIAPAGVIIGLIGMDTQSRSGPRGRLIFTSVLLTLVWILWALFWFSFLGFMGASCV
jgi:VIT1/CCC1 family predicted Fe2+/Mn2+ transporter